MIIYYLVFFFNLFFYISSQLKQCNNPSNLININKYSFLQEIDHFRFLEEEQLSMIGYIINIIEKQKDILDIKEVVDNRLAIIFKDDHHFDNITRIIDDFFNVSNPFFINIMKTISEELDYLKEENNKIENDNDNIFNSILILLRNKKIFDQIKEFIKENKDIVDIIYFIPNITYNIEYMEGLNKEEIEQVYNVLDLFRDYFRKYIDLIGVIPEITDFNNITDIYRTFFFYVYENNIKCVLHLLKIFRDNQYAAKYIPHLFNKFDIRLFCNYAEEHPDDIIKLYDILSKDKEILPKIPELLFNLGDKEYLIYTVLTNKNLLRYPDLIKIFLNMGFKYITSDYKADDYVKLLVQMTKGFVRVFFERNQDSIILTEECKDLINYAILGNISLTNEPNLSKDFSQFFIYKLLIDTTKSSNDLLDYDTCLKKPILLESINIDFETLEKYGLILTYVIATVDGTAKDNKDEFKTNTEIESNYYVSTMCLPQGINNGYNKAKNGKYLHCTKEDYGNIIKYILSIITNVTSTEIIAIPIKKNLIDEKFNGWQIGLVRMIPFYLFMIPFIFYIIILLFKKKQKKIKKSDKNNIDNNASNIINIKNNNNSKFIILINEFFNLENNANELFNFTTEKTNFNNVSRLLYTGGIMGICIILTILGQIYLILFNLPMKDFGLSHFYQLFMSPFYLFVFAGLRYSPRIIFSCSGFTLSLKYLSFLERESNNFLIKFIKFLCRQLHKYFMLLLVLFFMRYSYYHLEIYSFDLKPITELFRECVLKIPKEMFDFILSLLCINSFKINKMDSRVRHYLTDYLWIAFNEIVFFIVGTILITIGYQYKLRIDILIIILILILYIGKIIFYIIWFNLSNGIYTTLYYYLFDYGEFMLNPIFNLIYYLIGMYFGLINYNTGIIDEKDDMYGFFHKEDTKKIDGSFYKKHKTFISDNLKDIKDINDNKNKNRRKSFEIKKGKSKSEIFINNKKKFNDINDSKINNKNEISINSSNTQNYLTDFEKELRSKPFLTIPFKIKEWHTKIDNPYFFYLLLIFFIIIIILFMVVHILFVKYYNHVIDNKTEYSYLENNLEKRTLENIINNKLLNIIYLIDIEIVVFFVQWGFYILYIKQKYIIGFFNHIYWTFFNKFYFSFILSCNPTILYIFYNSETVVKLNTYNLLLFFFIDTVLIFISTMAKYLSLEFPLKKILKYLLSSEYKINFENEEDINEEGNDNLFVSSEDDSDDEDSENENI